jgi:hypothetical protein
MAGPIQIIPRGLLGFLNLKAQGSNPSQLIETVQPTYDIAPQYRESQAVLWPLATSATIATGAVGRLPFTTNPIVVPDNEIWYVIAYHVQTGVLPATDDAVFWPMIQTSRVGVITYEVPPMVGPYPAPSLVAPASKQRRVSCGGFYAPPGTELGALVDSIVAAVTMTFSVAGLRYVPMRV